MASHYADNIIHGRDHDQTHASQTRWRHEESSAYRRHAANVAPRQADERNDSKDLANFLNTTRVESDGPAAGRHKPLPVAANATSARQDFASGDVANALEVKCGPLLNYRRMENETWFGSVLVVTRGGGLAESAVTPELTVTVAHQQGNNVNGANQALDQDLYADPSADNTGGRSSWEARVAGVRLYSDSANTFWRFSLEVPMQQSEIRCDYSVSNLRFTAGKKTDKQHFFIPAISESMRIMFHSCNGFSVGTDEAAWSGPALWNDVNRVHQKTPFHVMLGGGDQIYNDGIRVHGPLKEWTSISNPKKRKDYPFPESLRRQCDEYYSNNYIRWYSTEPFASVNGQIAQLNLWDDHDIIDGFGSYVDEFMRCAVFRGIGGTANKYYLLFQHHLAPPMSTFTTDSPQTENHGGRPDSRQIENTYILQEKNIDSGYIIGSKPGPYVAEYSRSIYARLGARIAFFGIDARTERTRHQVNYPETYDIIVKRLRDELSAAKASSSPIKHLVVLLGIPIAYPRLTWLENIFSSPLIAPIKFLNKRFGFGGGFFNSFDGNIDLLDDLDDHYTARTHKKERLMLVHRLQELASEFSVRVSILGGDVHLAAVGRFYSNPKLNIPVANDYRYMVNIVSSAIVNKPPPQAVANLLARRNKIHHLDHDTDETLMNMFDKDPGDSNKTAASNKVTMPSRNWAMITENHNGAAQTVDAHGAAENPANGTLDAENPSSEPLPKVKDGHSALHRGEADAGTQHKAADYDKHGKGSDSSLDVCIRVEMDQHDAEGRTQPYGLTIPPLVYDEGVHRTTRKRDAFRGHSHGRVSNASSAV